MKINFDSADFECYRDGNDIVCVFAYADEPSYFNVPSYSGRNEDIVSFTVSLLDDRAFLSDFVSAWKQWFPTRVLCAAIRSCK